MTDRFNGDTQRRKACLGMSHGRVRIPYCLQQSGKPGSHLISPVAFPTHCGNVGFPTLKLNTPTEDSVGGVHWREILFPYCEKKNVEACPSSQCTPSPTI